MSVALSGQVPTQVRTVTGGNSVVVALPTTVTAALPAYVRMAGDFGTANIRLAVFNNATGWRVYDPYVVGDSATPIHLDLTDGDSKVSFGRDSGTGLVGWTVVSAL